MCVSLARWANIFCIPGALAFKLNVIRFTHSTRGGTCNTRASSGAQAPLSWNEDLAGAAGSLVVQPMFQDASSQGVRRTEDEFTELPDIAPSPVVSSETVGHGPDDSHFAREGGIQEAPCPPGTGELPTASGKDRTSPVWCSYVCVSYTRLRFITDAHMSDLPFACRRVNRVHFPPPGPCQYHVLPVLGTPFHGFGPSTVAWAHLCHERLPR